MAAVLRSNYITPEGLEALAREHEHLWKVERPRVTREVSIAAAHGDRSGELGSLLIQMSQKFFRVQIFFIQVSLNNFVESRGIKFRY